MAGYLDWASNRRLTVHLVLSQQWYVLMLEEKVASCDILRTCMVERNFEIYFDSSWFLLYMYKMCFHLGIWWCSRPVLSTSNRNLVPAGHVWMYFQKFYWSEDLMSLLGETTVDLYQKPKAHLSIPWAWGIGGIILSLKHRSTAVIIQVKRCSTDHFLT